MVHTLLSLVGDGRVVLQLDTYGQTLQEAKLFGNVVTEAGQSVAADVSGYYENDDIKLGDKDATIAVGVNVSNIGAKCLIQIPQDKISYLSI